MTASRSDSYFLSQDLGFLHRVQESLAAQCVAIGNEGWTVAFHRERANFVTQILNAPPQTSPYPQMFANSVATDSSVLADATAGGTVALTSGNAATQAALVTDAHIDSAIDSQFNSFIREPGD